MKKIKFRDYLVPLVQSGEKTVTWRLFDDKDFQAGDKVELQEFGNQTPFAYGIITDVIEKSFSEFTDEDKAGHEAYKSDIEMYTEFSSYYGQEIGPETLVKIIRFTLTK